MRSIDKARWLQLSPLLDEILDLDLEPPARSARLSALRAEDARGADDLQELLDRLPAMDREAFLERPAMLRDAGMAGQKIGPYTVERELGRGGMGSVWLARRTDGRYEGSVAIKFLNAGLMAGGAERFAREGSILARLAHPNIARLLDAGVTDGGAQPYLVLEYIDGLPIHRHCDEHALDIDARVRLFLDVLAAVAHAHNRLILHRDLKPSNILVTAAGEVKLLDFGIAKLIADDAPAPPTELTQRAGHAFTPQFAAPEQLQGGDVTTATDVYALGVLLYVLLGGQHPTASATTTAPLDQMRAVIETEPRRLSDAVRRSAEGTPATARRARELRGDLDNIVARALKKAPAARYANAAEFAADLRRYLNHEPVAARPDAAAYLLAKFVRRHRLGVVAGGAVGLALALGIGVALWEANEARHQRVQAEGLIEFMLSDLRKKLEPVGRIDVLDAVGEKSLAYYAAQDAGALDADSLGRRARALHLIGEIAELRGNLDEASRVFQRAADSTAELMARAPRDEQRIFDHAQSEYWVGYIARRRGRLAAAEESFGKYLQLARQLRQLDLDNLDWRVEENYAGENLGVIYLESTRPAQALKAFSETRDAWQRVVGVRPELHFELANTWGWIAKAREALGEYAAAIAAQQAKIETLGKLADAGKNRRIERSLANAKHEIGRLQLFLGQHRLAAQSASAALAHFEALFALDPSNMDWLAQMSFARAGLAEIQLALDEREAARGQLQQVADDSARLPATDAATSDRQLTLRGRWLVLSVQLAQGMGSASDMQDLEAFVAEVLARVGAGKAFDADLARIAASAELLLGDHKFERAGLVAARPYWLSAANRMQALAASGELPAMTLLAHARLRLGGAQEARALADRLQASPYRHPAYADLHQRLAHAAGAARSH